MYTLGVGDGVGGGGGRGSGGGGGGGKGRKQCCKLLVSKDYLFCFYCYQLLKVS